MIFRKEISAIALSLSVLLGPVAHSAGPLETQFWKDTFGTAPALQDLFANLDDLVNPDLQASCKTQTQIILADLSSYAGKSSQKSNEAKTYADNAIQTLKSNENSVCEEAVTRTYFIGSYFISQQDFIHTSTNWLYNSYSTRLGAEAEPAAIDATKNVLKAAVLLRMGRVHFLYSKLRTLLGGAWMSNEIYGAYDCVSSEIYLDPRMRPFDTGAIFQHELDHLERDKFVSSSVLEKDFSENSQFNWDAYLTFDESHAAISAADLQRFQFDRVSSKTALTDKQIIKKGQAYSVKKTYEAEGDFTFRTVGGPLEKIFDATGTDILINPNLDPKSYLNVFSMIHQAYFSGSPLNPSSLDLFSKAFGDESSSGIWFSSDPKTVVSEESFNQQFNSELRQTYKVPVNTIYGDGNANPGDVAFSIYRSVLDFQSSLDQESSSCTLYEAAAENGDVGNYAGLRFKVDDSSTPTNPGEHGSRPGEQGSRPGLGVHPCLFMKNSI